MVQNQKKPWYQSKTVWGGIIAVAAGILSVFGKNISPEMQQFMTDQAVQIATGIAAAVGGVLAIYGRIKAQGKLTL